MYLLQGRQELCVSGSRSGKKCARNQMVSLVLIVCLVSEISRRKPVFVGDPSTKAAVFAVACYDCDQD